MSIFTSIPTAPGNPGTHVSTPKQEACGRSGLLCGTQGPASVFERGPGCQSQVTSFPASQRLGCPVASSSSSRAARDGDVQSICSFPVFHSCGLEKCVHETSCCGIMSWVCAWALFSSADELNLSMCCAGLAGNLVFPTCSFFRGGRSEPTCPCPQLWVKEALLQYG